MEPRWATQRPTESVDGVLLELEGLVARYRQSGPVSPTPNRAGAERTALEKAAALRRARRARTSIFGSHADLFADPAWDLLLDLFVAHGNGKPVSISSACIAANVPATTGLRWIAALEGRGLIERRIDQHDRRRSYLYLNDEASTMLEAWFGTLP